MIQTIKNLNEKIRENEMAGNADFFEEYLADDLIFRRADGSFASKNEFKSGLTSREWRQLENSRVNIDYDDKYPAYAVVSLLADYDFTNKSDGAIKKGCARNIRFFRLEEGVKVYAWYNEGVDF